MMQLPAIPDLNEEQLVAVAAMHGWLRDDSQFFLLSGSAGTGKTFCVKHLIRLWKGRLIFTAPTNKATKVLRDTFRGSGYDPECRTIYSLLGLRLEPNGEIRELVAPDDPIDLSQYDAIIVDEASMVNSKLFQFIQATADEFGIKFLFMGDAAQLPPVGERESEVWGIAAGAKLSTVMRFDNQILALATAIRKVVDHPAPTVRVVTNNDGNEGIWRLNRVLFEEAVTAEAKLGGFGKPNHAKAIAWRNVRVDELNRLIRKQIFDDTRQQWLPSDRLIFTAPAKEFSEEAPTIATTDDEGGVESVRIARHPKHPHFQCWVLQITLDTGQRVAGWALHPDSQRAWDTEIENRAAEARKDPRKWKQFWSFKEDFHQLRYAYAITAHRAQGSTYDSAFVDASDILLNRDRQEAFRCLYVATTRPKRRLFFG